MAIDASRAWLVAGAATAGVLALGLLENLASAQLYSLTLHLPGIDKALHFAQSLAICSVVIAVLGRIGLSAATCVVFGVAVSLIGAGFDELQQSLRSDRTVELADFAAAASGTVVGVSAHALVSRPRVAMATGLIGLAAGGAIVYQSYLRTHEYNRGVLAERAGRPMEALRHYLNAVESGTDRPEAFNAAAWMMAEHGGDPERAAALAARSLEMRPGDADTLDTYGWCLYRAGRAAEALGPLRAALAAKPGIYCIHYHLGMAYLAVGDHAAAERHLRQQVLLMPATREAGLATAVLDTLGQPERMHR